MKKLYLLLAILGFILPLSQFILWLLAFGVDVPLIFHTITEDKLSLFAWLGVIVSAVVLVVFVLYERSQTVYAAIMGADCSDVVCRGLFRATAVFALTRDAFRKE